MEIQEALQILGTINAKGGNKQFRCSHCSHDSASVQPLYFRLPTTLNLSTGIEIRVGGNNLSPVHVSVVCDNCGLTQFFQIKQ